VALFGTLFVLGLFVAAPASAAYEQVGCFASQFHGLRESCEPRKPEEAFSEEIQLGAASGMAVNPSGAGGVEKGTIYAIIDTQNQGPWVVVYEPEKDSIGNPVAEGGLTFVEAWQWSPQPQPTKHCGPALEELCLPKAGEGTQPQAFGLAVDPANGNVYVLSGAAAHETGAKVVTEYDAHGEEITRFVEFEQGCATSACPSKVHSSPFIGGIAVDAAGDVYVFDLNEADDHYHRLMAFKPCTPGDFTSYCYAGQSEDIGAGFQGETRFPTQPAVDATGHVYTLTEEKYVQEFDLGVSRKAPICTFEFSKGGMYSMAVKPDGGVFFFSYKKETGFQTKLVHELAPCQNGTFKEVGKVEVRPERDDIKAMAFDPLRQFAPGREAGVLYGAAPGGTPGSGTGTGEPGQSALGYIFVPAEENPPVIESESISGVTATSARLQAVINPNGRPTHYAFQYLSDATFAANPPGDRFAGAGEAPFGGAEIKGGSVGVAVAVTVTGLAPATGYHFRVVASNHCTGEEKTCPVEGADESFPTFPVLGPDLPDRRVYELVSPAQKNGGQVVPADSRISSCGFPECKPGASDTRFPLQASSDGEAIAYEGQPFSPSGGVAGENEYIARRGPEGWQSVNLTPSLLTSKGGPPSGKGYVAFDPALGLGLMQQGLPSLSVEAPGEYPNFYLQATAAPSALQSLLTEAPPNRVPGGGAGRLEFTYAGASANLARAFFEANDALTPESTGGPAGKTNLYEWENGQLRSVNLGPIGESLPGATFGSAASLTGAISTDGSHAFWTSAAGQLYVRIDGVETRKVEDPGAFLVGSADGSKALLDDGCLYDVEAGACTDLTAGKGGFKAVLGHSEDLSRLYFVTGAAEGAGDLTIGSAMIANVHAATGTFRVGQAIEGNGIPAGTKIAAIGSGTLQLSAPATATEANVALTAQGLLTGEEENSRGEKAAVRGFNLYAWNEGSTSFIATLDATDSGSLGAAEASPDGDWFAFLSKAPLTGYENTGPCETGAGTSLVPCREAFLYEASSGKLSCVSCDPSGGSSLGETALREIEGLDPSNSPSYQPRFLVNSGRLYFDTQNSLSPADTNGGGEDVYQFEPNGMGTCANASGCVSLISGGREAGDSNFLAMDPSGDNVFFTTRDRLVPADKDELIDLYDARVGGGFASEAEPAPSPCSGEACQATQSPLAESQPNSSSPTEGNVKPVKCKKGKVKRNGHCVTKKKGKKHKHKQKGKGKKHEDKAKKSKQGGSK
jgi:hypothetical protein